jgi:trimethylamine corrinoid protein
MTDDIFVSARDSIEKGDAELAANIARQGLAAGINGLELMNKGFIPGINSVGELFGEGRLFLPELMMSASAMQQATDIVNASFGSDQARSQGRILLGTVEGDLHDIGKTIVAALFRANGFEVLDLGRDVPVARFIDEAEKFKADFIGTSALLTTTMTVQKQLEDELRRLNLKGKYRTIVGGAPVTQRWAERIGADAYAEDAGAGVKKVKEILAK